MPDAVLAGGAEAAIIPLGVAGFSNMKALSTTEDPAAACVPFDKPAAAALSWARAPASWCWKSTSTPWPGAPRSTRELCGYGDTCDAHHITARTHPEGLGGAASH